MSAPRLLRCALSLGLALLACGCEATWARWDGEEAVEERRFEDAVGHYRTALALDPAAGVEAQLAQARRDAARVRHEQAHEQAEAGDLDAARRSSEWAIHHDPAQEAYRERLFELRVQRRQVGDRLRQAQEAVEREDWLRAKRLLDPLLAFAKTVPQVEDLAQRSDAALVALYRQEAKRYALLGEHARASEFLAKASAIDPAATPELTQSRQRAQARALADQAADELKQKKLASALKLARRAYGLDASSRRVEAVLAEAQRVNVLAWLAAAERAPDAREALRHAAAAEAVGATQRALVQRIAKRKATYAKTLTARYLAQGLAYERMGHWGAAWLRYELGLKLRPGFAALEERRERVLAILRAQQRYRVVVQPMAEQGEVAPGGGELLARQLRLALTELFEGKRVEILGPRQLKNGVVAGLGLPPNAVLGGTAKRLWIDTRSRRVPRSLEYSAGLVPQLNRRVEQKKAAWQRAQQQLPNMQREAAKAERTAKEKQRAAQQAERAYQDAQRRLFPPGQRFELQEHSRRQRELNDYRRRRDQANQAATFAFGISITSQGLVRAQQSRAQRLLQDYLREPPYVDVPLRRTYRYEWVEITQTVHADVAVRLEDFSLPGQLGSWTAWAKVNEKDGMAAAFPAANLREDPLRLSGEQDFLRQGAARLAQELLGRVDKALAAWGTFSLRRARAERQAGHPADELHWLAVAWFQRGAGISTQDQRAVQARLLQLAGWDVASGEVDLKTLPPAP